MKKQKFRPYEEPIFRKPMPPFRITDTQSSDGKNKIPHIKTSSSTHKKPELLAARFQPFEQPKNMFLDEEKSKTCLIKQRPLKSHLAIDIFLNKQFNPLNEHPSLRKIHQGEQDNYSKLSASQGRHTTNNKTTKRNSAKKVHNSALLSLKQQRIMKLKHFTASPYLKNVSDVSKIFKMLRPVNGPNQSIKKQILQHNEENKKNHEIVVMRKTNQTFQQKRQTYLERIGLKPDSKVFVMNSRDQHIRQALLKRGWIELNDISDGFYHLKWVYSDNSSDYQHLNGYQLFNHFYNNQELTNKNNLRKNIKALKFQNQPLIPLTFDFGIAKQFKKFVENATLFEGIKILNLIKTIFQEYDSCDYERIVSNVNYFKFQNKNTLLKTARKRDMKRILELIGVKKFTQEVQNLVHNCIELMNFLVKQLEDETEIRYSIFKSESMEKKGDHILSVFDYFHSMVKSFQSLELLLCLPKFLKVQIIKLHRHFLSHTSLFRKSYGFGNAWIIKPTGVSRGSGIYIESDYKKLMTQTNNQHGKIVQKYIQRPFLLSDKRKFDIRQWVLVKSFDPLVVYMYKNLYGRICPEKYQQNDFQNIQKHLTNYSLSKEHYRSRNGGSFLSTQLSDDHSQLPSNTGTKKMSAASIILQHDLERHINENYGGKKDWEQIKLQIKQNVIRTLKASAGGIAQNPSCFEVYGFDILLDEQLDVFVIEVNLSPACEKREGLEVYLEEMSHGLVDLAEVWLGMSKREKRNESENEVWERLDEDTIDLELEMIKQDKVKEQKVVIIQKWVRSHILAK